MKYLILSLMLVLTSLVSLSAQSTTPTSEQKQAINPLVNEGFTQWSASWTYDKYVSRSAKINVISIDEDYGDLVVYGTFSYIRLLSSFEGTFIAKINNSGKLMSITYTDADGLRDTKSFY